MFVGMSSRSRATTTATQRKITLHEVAESGGVGLLIFCSGGRAHYGGCNHSGRIELWLALRRWRSNRRLDELPLRCCRCGADAPDVRPEFPSKNKADDTQHHEYLARWRAGRE